MGKQFLAAIDQGTTGSTVMLIDVSQRNEPRIVGKATTDFPQYFPQQGWVEHDLHEIWQSVAKSYSQAAHEVRKVQEYRDFHESQIIGIGITNQRETLCVFDRQSSEPLCRAIVWQCRRSSDVCAELRRQGHSKMVAAKTGLVLDPYFSGTKLAWLMENHQEVARSLKAGKAIVGTIDSYLIHRLTGGVVHATEASNASRTLMYNIHSGKWDPELLEILRIPGADILPEVKDSATRFGVTKNVGFLPDGIPISGVLGDQQAALAGQACFGGGDAKCTYGTGAFLLLNLGHLALASDSGMLTTVAWRLGGKTTYAFEGSVFIAGAAVQFLRDQMHFVAKAGETEALAAQAEAAPHVYFVPALTGLGAPYWDANARGAFLGLTRGTTVAQLVRATLESIGLQVADLVRAMRQDYPGEWNVLRVDGGAAANNLLMQIQADYTGIAVDRPRNLETTAFGAAMFAGLGIGLYENLDELRGVRKPDRVFLPPREATRIQVCQQHLEGWSRAVQAVQVFAGKSSGA